MGLQIISPVELFTPGSADDLSPDAAHAILLQMQERILEHGATPPPGYQLGKLVVWTLSPTPGQLNSFGPRYCFVKDPTPQPQHSPALGESILNRIFAGEPAPEGWFYGTALTQDTDVPGAPVVTQDVLFYKIGKKK